MIARNEIVLTEIVNEYEFLIREVKKLKIMVAALMAEKDDLELNVCRKLRAEYDEKIGNLELQITQYNLEIEKLRSVIESMQAAVNNDIKMTRENAEKEADRKLQGFYDDLEKRTQQARKDQEYARQRAQKDKENAENAGFDDSNEGYDEVNWEEFFKSFDDFFKAFDEMFGSGRGSGQDRDAEDDHSHRDHEDGTSARKNINPAKELRALYLKILKALHPDNKKDRTQKDDELLRDAIKAYESGDLERLREIAETIEDEVVEARFQNSPEDIEELKRLLKQLSDQRYDLQNSICRIKISFPYNMKEFLEDEAAVAARQEELKSIIESCRNTISVLNERIALLQKEMGV
ncbi:MAG: hypothetical protein K6E91_11745 [Butyrivibrio sp.]|nr:hypothetical protein [Butyrivibrio sp.]